MASKHKHIFDIVKSFGMVYTYRFCWCGAYKNVKGKVIPARPHKKDYSLYNSLKFGRYHP